MENKSLMMIIRIVIAIVGIIGVVILEMNRMPASYVWAWIVLIAILLFSFSPEIKRLFVGTNGVELEHFQEKFRRVNQALVEYDEFKKTILPLLKITMSEIAFNNYLGIPARPDDLIDFLNHIKNLSPSIVKLSATLMAYSYNWSRKLNQLWHNIRWTTIA